MNELNYPSAYLAQFNSNGFIDQQGLDEDESFAQQTLNTLAGQFIAHAGIADDYANRVAICSIFRAESHFVTLGGPMKCAFDPSFYMGIGVALNALRSVVTGSLPVASEGSDVIVMLHDTISAFFHRDQIMRDGGTC